MKLFEGLNLFGRRKPEQAMGLGERFPLSKQMIQAIRTHSAQLSSTDLSAYKFERRRSDHPDARADLVIYDQNETPVLDGREMAHGFTFWPHKTG